MEKITRFPPEPNGFLHLGHCKSIFINWASDNKCHLRLDDTNPEAEKKDFIRYIIEDIKWLGFDPGHITYTSDYFDFFSFRQAFSFGLFGKCFLILFILLDFGIWFDFNF